MARRTKLLTINEADPQYRDNGKSFLITEMSADQAEQWANRFMLAMANADAPLPDELMNSGMAALASVGIAASFAQALQKLSYETVKPLLDEMISCVQFQHDPKQLPQAIFPGVNCQIEEFPTFWTLRLAWLELHTGFTVAAAARTTAAPSAARAA
jgi:hypothetical protein